MQVYLLWLHDSVLGVYAKQSSARIAAALHKKEHSQPGYEWREYKSCGRIRWAQHMKPGARWTGGRSPVARLEIESREVE